MAIKPINPKEAISEKNIPDEVIESFSELISEKLDFSGTAKIFQYDVIARIISKGKGLITKENIEDIFFKKWLDVENIYNKIGWTVSYNKPGFNESYPSTFTFKAKG